MNREDLLQSLELVSPALGKGDLVPALAFLWFENKHVLAHDDHISIEASCPLNFCGGVDGELLIPILKRSLAKEVNITIEDETFRLKMGNTNLKLRVMHAGHKPFTMPNPKTKPLQFGFREFKAGLEHCLKSIGHDVSNPHWWGVTMEVCGDTLCIFGGTSETLVRATVPLKSKPMFKHTILHPKFCEQLVKHLQRGKGDLMIADDHAMFVNNEVRIFGRAIATED